MGFFKKYNSHGMAGYSIYGGFRTKFKSRQLFQ